VQIAFGRGEEKELRESPFHWQTWKKERSKGELAFFFKHEKGGGRVPRYRGEKRFLEGKEKAARPLLGRERNFISGKMREERQTSVSIEEDPSEKEGKEKDSGGDQVVSQRDGERPL